MNADDLRRSLHGAGADAEAREAARQREWLRGVTEGGERALAGSLLILAAASDGVEGFPAEVSLQSPNGHGAGYVARFAGNPPAWGLSPVPFQTALLPLSGLPTLSRGDTLAQALRALGVGVSPAALDALGRRAFPPGASDDETRSALARALLRVTPNARLGAALHPLSVMRVLALPKPRSLDPEILLDALERAGVPLASSHQDGRNALHMLANDWGAGEVEAVYLARILAARGIPSDARDASGQTPLHAASAHGPIRPALIRALVRLGADPNAADAVRGCAPLHLAAERLGSRMGADFPSSMDRGRIREVVEALLRAGADPGARDGEGRTPLDAFRSSLSGEDDRDHRAIEEAEELLRPPSPGPRP